MNRTLIGAVSMAALLAFGLSACGQNETEYNSAAGDEANSEDASSGSTDERTAANEPGAASESEEMQATPNTGGVEPATASAATAEMTDDAMAVAIAEISDKSDAERVADESFDQADADGNGMLDHSEYMNLAMSAEHYAPSPGDDGQTAGGEVSGVEPPNEPMSGEGDVSGSPPAPAASQTAESEAAPAIDAAFAEAAGEDGEMSEEELRTAFLARFDIADANGDDQLDETERQTFAQLTAGEQPAE